MLHYNKQLLAKRKGCEFRISGRKIRAYRALLIAGEGLRDDEAVEGAGAGAEAGGDHVVDDVGDAGGVALTGALHELLHEGEPQPLLRRRHRGAR